MSRTTDTETSARRLFETFHARSSSRRTEMNFDWPEKMQHIGEAKAELYRSNKWKSNLSETEDYKHIAEARQDCYVTPGFLHEWRSGGERLKVYGPTVPVSKLIGSPAPGVFSTIAPMLGLQIHLFGSGGRLMSEDDGLFEVTVARGMWGAARREKDNKAFLFVYTREHGVHIIITGTELDVLADGIVG